MDSLSIDLSKVDKRVRVTRRGNIAGLVAQDGSGTVWAAAELTDLIEAIDRGGRHFRGRMLDAIFLQYALFYLLGIGKLSQSVNYERALVSSEFNFRPDAVSFILTKLCNFRCPHCYNDSGLPHRNELTRSEKVSTVDYLGRWGVRHLILSGGEPTLDSSLRDILELACHYRMKVKLTTNGWEMPVCLLDAISAGVIAQVNVSLDGPDAQTHDGFREKPGSFDRIITGIRKLQDAGLRNIILNSCIGSGRVNQMASITRLAIQMGCRYISFKAVLYTGRENAGAKDMILSPSEMAMFHAERDRLQSTFKGAILIEGNLITGNVPRELLDGVSCNAATTSMTIDADGSMFPCEIISPFVTAPNVRHVTAAHAWVENAVFGNFRKVKSGLTGGCGTTGCPGSAMGSRQLTTIAS